MWRKLCDRIVVGYGLIGKSDKALIMNYSKVADPVLESRAVLTRKGLFGILLFRSEALKGYCMKQLDEKSH